MFATETDFRANSRASNSLGKSNARRSQRERGVQQHLGNDAEPLHLDALARMCLDSAWADFACLRASAKHVIDHQCKFGPHEFPAERRDIDDALQGDGTAQATNESQSICSDERGGVWVCIPRHARNQIIRAEPDRTRPACAAVHEASHSCLLRDGLSHDYRREFYRVEDGTLEEMAQTVVGTTDRVRARKHVWLQPDESQGVRLFTLSPSRDIDAGRWQSRGKQS